MTYLVVLKVQLDGREGGDLGVLQLVDSGVDLGDNDVVVLLKVLGQLVVDGHQLFAVSAPGEQTNYNSLLDQNRS